MKNISLLVDLKMPAYKALLEWKPKVGITTSILPSETIGQNTDEKDVDMFIRR